MRYVTWGGGGHPKYYSALLSVTGDKGLKIMKNCVTQFMYDPYVIVLSLKFVMIVDVYSKFKFLQTFTIVISEETVS